MHVVDEIADEPDERLTAARHAETPRPRATPASRPTGG